MAVKETLRATIQRLAADNQFLRELNSTLITVKENSEAMIIDMDKTIRELRTENSQLRTDLAFAVERANEADKRTRAQIRRVNRLSMKGDSRSAAHEAARAEAIRTGRVVKVGAQS